MLFFKERYPHGIFANGRAFVPAQEKKSNLQSKNCKLYDAKFLRLAMRQHIYVVSSLKSTCLSKNNMPIKK